MQDIIIALILMVIIILIGTLVLFRFLRNRAQKFAYTAAFAYLACTATLYYIDVVQYEQSWAIPIYVVCFVVIPVAMYYVIYSLVSSRNVMRSSPIGSEPDTGFPREDYSQPVPSLEEDALPRKTTPCSSLEALEAARAMYSRDSIMGVLDCERTYQIIPSSKILTNRIKVIEAEYSAPIIFDEKIAYPPEPEASEEPGQTGLDGTLEYDACYAAADSLKEKGHAMVAAMLYAECVLLATQDKDRNRAFFQEISCYIKEGRNRKAYERACDLVDSSTLDPVESIKAKAIIAMLKNDADHL